MSSPAQHVFSVEIIGGSESVILDNNDIVQVYFIEDIFSYLKTGKVVFSDIQGLHEHLPIVGDETVKITYGSILEPNGAHELKTAEFEVYKIGDIENTEDRYRHVVELFIVDKQHKKLHHPSFSASYKCKLYTDIIKEIGEKHAGFEWADFEDCEELKDYYYTGLKTPAQDLKWLMDRCHSVVSGQPGYLIYSDTKNMGKQNLKSLEFLLAMSEPLPLFDNLYVVHAHHEYNVNNIIKYRVHRGDKQALSDLMGGCNLGWDVRRRKHFKNIYTYQDGLAKYTCLGKYSLFNEGKDSLMFNKQQLTGENDEEFVMKNMYWSEWIKRYSLQQTVSIILEGHSRRYCGGYIEIVWPSSVEEDIIDKQMCGLFLVKSITHSFIPNNQPIYQQRMELIKNGMNDTDGTLTAAAKQRTSARVTEVGQDLNIQFDGHGNVRGL